jgi:hypothetical protein
MECKMIKVAIPTTTTINPWVCVNNLTHIKTIFAMWHMGFCFLKCFKEQQAMNNENGNLLFGGS